MVSKLFFCSHGNGFLPFLLVFGPFCTLYQSSQKRHFHLYLQAMQLAMAAIVGLAPLSGGAAAPWRSLLAVSRLLSLVELPVRLREVSFTVHGEGL